MKVKGLSKRVLVIVGVLIVALSGCGTKEETPEVTVTVTPTEAPSQELDEEFSEESSDEWEYDDTTVEAPGQDDRDVGGFDEGDVPQTAIEDISGEGMNDGKMPNMAGMKEVAVGKSVKFKSDAGADLCLFTIESVKTSDMTIEHMGDVTDKKVVIVSYSYKNISAEGSILFDDMSFKLVANNTLGIPYFSAELTPAPESGKGETVFGQVAFLVDSSCKDVIVAFEDASVNARAIFKATIK